ncbi:MAG: TMAO reductase system sensor histidine kinase/response regulator TorS [Pseudomonadota bacterium]
MRKFGIAAKLYLAFGGLFVLAIIASIVGWQGFQRISDSQTSVIDQAIPGLRQAHSLAALNASTSAAAQQLLRARDAAEREHTSRILFAHIDALNALLDDFERSGFATSALPGLRDTVADLVDKLRSEDALVQQRLYHQQLLSQQVAELENATVELNELADSLVANAAATTTAITSSLYDMVEQRADDQALYQVFDRLLEVDLDAMERMYELRLRSANLRSLFNEVSKETDPEALQVLRDQTLENLSIVKRRVGEINDPQRRQQAEGLLSAMEVDQGPLAVFGLFETRRSLSAIERELSELSVAAEVASQRLNQSVNELNTSGGELINRVSTVARKALDSSRSLFNWISLFALIVAAIVLWGFVSRNVIRRLLSLETATRSIADGDYDVEIHARGNDELANMGKALRGFRNNAIEKQRVDEELRDHKAHLEELVEQRTEQLKVANTRLSDEARNHADARARAEQANQAKTAFLATMSHELRTPLSGALGTLHLLDDTTLDPQQRQYTHTVEVANKALLEIVNEILDYSQMEAGKLKLDNRPFNLSELLRDVVDLMAVPVQERGNRLALDYSSDDLPAYLVGDAGKLHQVLINLVGNANKFTDAGTITVNAQVTADPDSSRAVVEIEVSDTGIGIPSEKLEEVFQAFTQVDASSSREYSGVGLGLAICERLVGALSGKIALTSTPGEGTMVVVRLELETAIEDHTEKLSDRDPGLPRQHSLRALVVEDDETNRMVAQSYLEKLGHDVLVASSGEQALSLIEAHRVSLLLLDISLPGIDGLEILTRVRANDNPDIAGLPVIAMSAHVFAEEIESYLNAGMNGFLGKPYTVAELDRAIDQVARGTELETQLTAEVSSAVLDSTAIEADIEALGLARVQEIAALFFADGGAMRSELTDAIDAGLLPNVVTVAHRLRGAAANFGLNNLCAVLVEIEAIAGRAEQVTEMHRSGFERCYQESIAELRDYMASKTTAAPAKVGT